MGVGADLAADVDGLTMGGKLGHEQTNAIMIACKKERFGHGA